MGWRDGRIDPSPDRGSGNSDGVRASQLQHAVDDMDSDVHLGRLAFVGVRAQSVLVVGSRTLMLLFLCELVKAQAADETCPALRLRSPATVASASWNRCSFMGG